VIAEGNETPGGEAGGGPEGRGRRSEGDLLAERRARRAAESGEHALTRRAEAAEATVRTLETHVASLQQRLGDAEQESRRIADLLDAERAPRHGERADLAQRQSAPHEATLERELQRASQREYAEQRLRVDAEDRSFALERESRAEIERLTRRLNASEREAQALAGRLEIVQRELAEAEQAAATEHSGMLRGELALRSRLSELENATLELHGALEVERAARRRAEYLLDALRDAQRSALGALGGLADTIARLRQAALATPDPPSEPPPPHPAAASHSTEPAPEPPLAAALAALAAQGEPRPAESAPVPAGAESTPAALSQLRALAAAQAVHDVPDEIRSAEMAEALAAAVERLRARVEEHGAEGGEPVPRRPVHKHSMSLITRTRLALRRRRERRKQRRER
jgi:hypothetical protein